MRVKKHSTSTNLLESLNDWTISLSNHHTVVVAYIDFQKAFDSVSHPKLLHKLSSYGINGNRRIRIDRQKVEYLRGIK